MVDNTFVMGINVGFVICLLLTLVILDVKVKVLDEVCVELWGSVRIDPAGILVKETFVCMNKSLAVEPVEEELIVLRGEE